MSAARLFAAGASALVLVGALFALPMPGHAKVALGTQHVASAGDWPVPVPGWFWEWARWYLHRGEFEDKPFRARETRPASAPQRIPPWAWRRVKALAGSGRATDLWADLRRPLRLTQLPAGAACPRSPGGRPAPEVAIALGNGPAYPVLGMPEPPPHTDGVADLRGDIYRDGWYLHKTLWAIDEAYGGRLLVRAARVDRPERVLLEGGPELTFADVFQPGWRYRPSTTYVRGPGCYAFQVDGTTFSRIVIFEARLGVGGIP